MRRRYMKHAYDQRTGARVPARTLKRDGELGILTQFPDPVHPLRFRTPPKDESPRRRVVTRNMNAGVGASFRHGASGYADQPGMPLVAGAFAAVPGAVVEVT